MTHELPNLAIVSIPERSCTPRCPSFTCPNRRSTPTLIGFRYVRCYYYGVRHQFITTRVIFDVQTSGPTERPGAMLRGSIKYYYSTHGTEFRPLLYLGPESGMPQLVTSIAWSKTAVGLYFLLGF